MIPTAPNPQHLRPVGHREYRTRPSDQRGSSFGHTASCHPPETALLCTVVEKAFACLCEDTPSRPEESKLFVKKISRIFLRRSRLSARSSSRPFVVAIRVARLLLFPLFCMKNSNEPEGICALFSGEGQRLPTRVPLTYKLLCSFQKLSSFPSFFRLVVVGFVLQHWI